jgi:hypothetical protein
MPFCLVSGQSSGKAISTPKVKKYAFYRGFLEESPLIILRVQVWAEHDLWPTNPFRPTCQSKTVPLVVADARLICAAGAFVGLN